MYANNMFVTNTQIWITTQSFSYALELYNNKDSRESYIVDLQKAKEYIDFELDRCYNEIYKINIEGSVADKKIVL